jgi:hypothetical protein
MADDQVDIKIVTTADTAGVKETADQLRELKRQAIAAGISTGDLDKQIQAAEKQTVKMGKEGTENVEGLRKAFVRLGNTIPGVGTLMQAMVSAPALAITALSVGIGILITKWQAWKKEIEDAAKALDALNLAKMNSMRDATQAAALAMHQFVLDLERASEAKDPFAGRTFATPEEEFAARAGASAKLKAEAVAAKQAAVDNAKDPAVISAIAERDAAASKQAALKEASRNAGLTGEQVGRLTLAGSSPQQVAAIDAEIKAKALAEESANQAKIDAANATILANQQRQSTLEAAATRAAGTFQTNLTGQNRAAGASSYVPTIANAASGADALRAGGSATAEQSAAIAQMVQTFNLSKMTNAQILEMLGRMNDSQEAFNTALKQLQSRQNSSARLPQ